MEVRVMAARLRYAARASRHGGGWLHALLRSPAAAGWRREVVKAATTMRAALTPRLDDLPDPDVSMQAWERLWLDHPEEWRLLVARFVAHTTSEAGRPAVAAVPPAVRDVEELAWECSECASCFPDRRALLVHKRFAHGARTLSRRAVLTSVCPNCGVDFHHRLRAVRHIESATACCLALHLRQLPICELDDPALLAANAADAEWVRKCRRLGRHVLAGPPPVRPAVHPAEVAE